MSYHIQVKHDTMHRKWHKLSVSCKDHAALEKDLTLYLMQYASDNQMNWHQLASQVIDHNGVVMSTRVSNATFNRLSK